MENRFRFLKEVVAVVSEVYPIDRIGVRISPNGVFGNMGSSDNDVMFLYVASQLNGKVGYIHVLDGLGYGWHNLCKQVKLIDIKKKYDGVIISNIDLTKDIAEGVIRTGTADLACFGRLYINNPDLAERMQNDWPLSTQVIVLLLLNIFTLIDRYTYENMNTCSKGHISIYIYMKFCIHICVIKLS